MWLNEEYLKRLPEEWQEIIASDPSETLFNNIVLITFEDGSNATFKHAEMYYKPAKKMRGADGYDYYFDICVLTEHCGYHVFPCIETGNFTSVEWLQNLTDVEEEELNRLDS